MKTGIHFQPCKTGSSKQHNERDIDYLESVEKSGKKTYDLFADRTRMNRRWTNPAYPGTLDNILEDMRQRYRDKVGQAPQEKERTVTVKGKTKTIAGWSPIKEGVCPIKEETTIDDFRPFINWLKTQGINVISVHLHFDEGHIDAKTGERKYNRHAHIVADWTDAETGKTLKVGKQVMSQMQDELARSLGMERGELAAETKKKHLPATEYRANQAAAKLAELSVEISIAEDAKAVALQRKADAEARRDQAETEANRENFKSNLFDVGARMAAVFGRGVVAESKAEAEEAERRALEAEQRALEAEAAQQAAEKARKEAENARISAERAESRAQNEKAAYGREMYEQGQTAGYAQGRKSTSSSLEQLQKLLEVKQEQLDELRSSRDARLDDFRAKAKQQLEEAARIVSATDEMLNTAVQAFPQLENLEENLADMEAAGLSATQKIDLLRKGAIETDIKIRTAANKWHTVKNVAVQIARSSKNVMRVWFNDKPWSSFVKAIKEKLQPQRRM